jgi:hypothetical protein
MVLFLTFRQLTFQRLLFGNIHQHADQAAYIAFSEFDGGLPCVDGPLLSRVS